MKNLIAFLTVYLIAFSSKSSDTCRITLDLVNLVNDKVKVIFYPAKTPELNAEFVMPSVIPGSYSRKDYGRFISGIKAFDANGKKLSVKKTGNNVFKIPKGNLLHRLEYFVDDTWDASKDNYIFQPGGTNIEAGKNFVLNHQGFYGYLEGQKMYPYKITCKRPSDLYAFGAPEIRRGKSADTIVATNYVNLVDSPVMIANLDTVSFTTGNMRVFIGVYSENGYVRSDAIYKAIEPLAKALKNFFGELPVNNYHFIMYFPTRGRFGITENGGFGALEHSYSSFYFLPETKDRGQLIDMVQSVAGHEFLHILTPLNIHSEEIDNFDFRHPKMSKHLWMYEGVTEYFSHLIRAKSKLIDEKGFQEEMLGKIRAAEKYPIVSFTEMSKNILDNPWKEMYSNVYDKGALLAMLLDIRLVELSKGNLGMRELMMLLAKKYGPEVPFVDDELFTVIVQMSFPEIKDFISKFIEGKEELPYKSYFSLIGWEFFKDEEVEYLTFGDFKLYGNRGTGEVMVLNAPTMRNNFGLKSYDKILEVNGIKIKPDNDSLFDLLEEPVSNAEIRLKITRDKADQILQARPHSKKEIKAYYLRKSPVLTKDQIEFRNWYFNR